jgi:hypothetical protein
LKNKGIDYQIDILFADSENKRVDTQNVSLNKSLMLQRDQAASQLDEYIKTSLLSSSLTVYQTSRLEQMMKERY